MITPNFSLKGLISACAMWLESESQTYVYHMLAITNACNHRAFNVTLVAAIIPLIYSKFWLAGMWYTEERHSLHWFISLTVLLRRIFTWLKSYSLRNHNTEQLQLLQNLCMRVFFFFFLICMFVLGRIHREEQKGGKRLGTTGKR